MPLFPEHIQDILDLPEVIRIRTGEKGKEAIG